MRLSMLIAFCGALIPGIVFADSLFWPPPFSLNDDNAQVSFSIDSTWHEVKGSSKNISGRVWLEDVSSLPSLRAEMQFPVASFDTDNASRDERMREVLMAEKYPVVKVHIQSISGWPEQLPSALANSAAQPLRLILHARVRVKDVEKSLDIVAELRKEKQGYSLSGSTPLRWDEFGVEDPSILIAHLEKEMSIRFHIHIPS